MSPTSTRHTTARSRQTPATVRNFGWFRGTSYAAYAKTQPAAAYATCSSRHFGVFSGNADNSGGVRPPTALSGCSATAPGPCQWCAI
jgi:hypothetical protein